MLTEKLLAAAAWGLVVFIRAFQQRNVAHMHFKWILPTSWVFAFVELIGLTGIVKVGFSWDFAIMLGTATGLSCMASMWIHNRYIGVHNEQS